MLKNIPEIITPDLMKILMEMGHGDEICFGDANFPSQSMGARVVRCDGHTITRLLPAVLQLFPLDVFVPNPAALMEKVREEDPAPKVWEEYRRIIGENDFSSAFKDFKMEERFAFYERTKQCYAVVATSEREPYANIILKKGVIF